MEQHNFHVYMYFFLSQISTKEAPFFFVSDAYNAIVKQEQNADTIAQKIGQTQLQENTNLNGRITIAERKAKAAQKIALLKRIRSLLNSLSQKKIIEKTTYIKSETNGYAALQYRIVNYNEKFPK